MNRVDWTRDPARLTVAALASYRLVRLAQRDTLPPLPAIRQTLQERLKDHPAEELLFCPWCLGFWTSLAVSGLASTERGWKILTPLALSAVVGFLAGHDPD